MFGPYRQSPFIYLTTKSIQDLAFLNESNVDAIDEAGRTHLFWAAADQPNFHAVKYLLNLGANPKHEVRMRLTTDGNDEFMKRLCLDAPPIRNLLQYMLYVTENPDERIIVELIKAGTPITADVVIELLRDLDYFSLDCFRLLLRAYPDLKTLDENGWSLFHHICHFGDLRILKLLVEEFHFNVNELTKNYDSYSPIAITVMSLDNVWEDTEEKVNYLLDQGGELLATEIDFVFYKTHHSGSPLALRNILATRLPVQMLHACSTIPVDLLRDFSNRLYQPRTYVNFEDVKTKTGLLLRTIVTYCGTEDPKGKFTSTCNSLVDPAIFEWESTMESLLSGFAKHCKNAGSSEVVFKEKLKYEYCTYQLFVVHKSDYGYSIAFEEPVPNLRIWFIQRGKYCASIHLCVTK